jgi:acyl-CoA thioester hydrolase
MQDSARPPSPTSGWFEGRTHCLPVRVYYEDTDFTGVVYHANYVRYFERGRSDFLRAIGTEHTRMRELDTAFVVTRLEIGFKKPARIDDALLVRTRYETVKGPRLVVHQSIERDGLLLTNAEVEVVCIDLQGRPRRAPAELTQKIAAYLAP